MARVTRHGRRRGVAADRTRSPVREDCFGRSPDGPRLATGCASELARCSGLRGAVREEAPQAHHLLRRVSIRRVEAVSQEMVLERERRSLPLVVSLRRIVEDGTVRGVVVERVGPGSDPRSCRASTRPRADGERPSQRGRAGRPRVRIHHDAGPSAGRRGHGRPRSRSSGAIQPLRKKLDREVKQLFSGGSWRCSWLLTAPTGVVWCNCPHIPGHDASILKHQTNIEVEPAPVHKVADFVRAHYPGFQRAYILDAALAARRAPDSSARGEYVVTRRTSSSAGRFPTCGARPRLTTRPIAASCPRASRGLLVAGRCYSATWRLSASAERSPADGDGEAAAPRRAQPRIQRGAA